MIPCIKGGIYFSRLSYHQILPETGLNSTHFFLIQKVVVVPFLPVAVCILEITALTTHTAHRGVSELRVGS